jgi:hypothetical protein
MLRAIVPLLLTGLTLGGCARMEITRSGALSSYAGLTSSDGILTKTRFRVDHAPLVKATTAYLARTRISLSSQAPNLSADQLSFVANIVDRTLCIKLGERFTIVDNPKDADFSVRATITALQPTNVVSAGVSSVAGIGSTVVNATTGLPLRVPRIPIGLGGLAAEAEALDRNRRSLASLEWARGADILTTRARASSEADAYALASEFGADFARLVITGEDPMKLASPQLPSATSVGAFLGLSSGQKACARFGRDPGLVGFVGGGIGVPPSWTDGGKSGDALQSVAD